MIVNLIRLVSSAPEPFLWQILKHLSGQLTITTAAGTKYDERRLVLGKYTLLLNYVMMNFLIIKATAINHFQFKFHRVNGAQSLIETRWKLYKLSLKLITNMMKGKLYQISSKSSSLRSNPEFVIFIEFS